MSDYTYYAHPKGKKGGPDHTFSSNDALILWAYFQGGVFDTHDVWRVRNAIIEAVRTSEE